MNDGEQKMELRSRDPVTTSTLLTAQQQLKTQRQKTMSQHPTARLPITTLVSREVPLCRSAAITINLNQFWRQMDGWIM